MKAEVLMDCQREGVFNNNIFPSHAGAASFADECQENVYEVGNEKPDDFDEESVMSVRGKSLVSRPPPVLSRRNNSVTSVYHSDTNTSDAKVDLANEIEDDSVSNTSIKNNENKELILPSPSLELHENNMETNSSDISFSQFSYVSNDTNKSDLDEGEEALSTPRDQMNVTLGTCVSGDEVEEEVGGEDNEMSDVSIQSDHDVTNETPTLKIDLNDMIPILVDNTDRKEDDQEQEVIEEEKSEHPSSMRKSEKIEKKTPRHLVQYSDKQTERIRAKEGEIRRQHRQQRKKARLGLQAQERRGPGSGSGGGSDDLLPNSTHAPSDNTEDTLSALPLSQQPVPSTPSQSRRQPQAWKTAGKTRRKPVYDGVPDSPPGAGAGSKWSRGGQEQHRAGPGGIMVDDDDDDEDDEYPVMEWNH